MSLFLETIKIVNGRRMNLEGHNRRMNDCRKVHFPKVKRINLEHEVIVPENFKKGLVKCRVLYGEEITSVTFQEYHFKNPRIFKIIENDTISYTWKSADRSLLDFFYNGRGNADDIIISKNGFLTDSFYANILLKRDGKWFTPENPLLKGTMRELLISKGIVSTAIIKTEDLFEYEELKIVNAMISIETHTPVKISKQNIIT